jgi:hypothetical protein
MVRSDAGCGAAAAGTGPADAGAVDADAVWAEPTVMSPRGSTVGAAGAAVVAILLEIGADVAAVFRPLRAVANAVGTDRPVRATVVAAPAVVLVLAELYAVATARPLRLRTMARAAHARRASRAMMPASPAIRFVGLKVTAGVAAARLAFGAGLAAFVAMRAIDDDLDALAGAASFGSGHAAFPDAEVATGARSGRRGGSAAAEEPGQPSGRRCRC